MLPSCPIRARNVCSGPKWNGTLSSILPPGFSTRTHSERALRKSGMCSITSSEITASKLASAKLRRSQVFVTDSMAIGAALARPVPQVLASHGSGKS